MRQWLALLALMCALLSAAALADSRPMSLAEALRQALDHSPLLDQYRSRVAQSRFQLREFQAEALPQLTGTSLYNHLEPHVKTNFGGGSLTVVAQNNYNIGITLSQLITSFGRVGWHTAAARLAMKQSEQDYRQQAEGLLEQVETAYEQALLAQKNVAIAQQQVDVQEAHLKESQKLYKGGVVAGFDVLSNETSLSQSRQQLLIAINSRNTADSSLSSVLGLPTNLTLSLQEQPAPQPPPQDYQEAYQRAYSRRPELQSLRFAHESAKALESWREGQHYPNLSVNTTYDTRNIVGFGTSPNQWSTNLVLAVPFYDGGLTNAQVQEAREQVRQLAALHESERRAVELEVQNAWFNLNNTWQQITVAHQAVVQATDALRVAEVRYRNGVGTFLERQDAVTALAQAQFAEANAVAQYHIAQSHWQRVTSAEYPVEVPGLSRQGEVLPSLEQYTTRQPAAVPRP